MAPPDFAAAIGGHPIVADILWRRGYTTVEAARAFLDPELYTPAAPEEMPGMTEAVNRLRAAIAQGEHIRVWGDFDADGQTSTSLLVLGLRALGATVDYTIPNRALHSHGLNKPGIAQARADGARVLLTCDCGVTDFEEVAFARSIGLDVIISDHHDLGASLPDACAVVNPKRLPGDHAVAHLPGVGVAYKLIEALLLPLSPAHLLDLVALGIVADVAYQRGDTRYLLQRGLACLRTNPRPGVRALLRVANIDPADLSADSIGYQIGPRLNAVGRLDDATVSVELLTTEDQARANELAARVEALNQERRVLQRAVEEDAFRQIGQDPSQQRHAAIVLVSSSWHPSVLGVVASSVSNRYGKPAILISARPGEIGRGSGRSVRGVDIHAAITAQGQWIESSGGHPMAAGFGIRGENVSAFREGIEHYLRSLAPVTAPADEQMEEAVLPWRDVSLRLCEDLERLAPFGPGNPRPLLKSECLEPVRAEQLGNDGRHQSVYFRDESGHVNKVVWWRSGGQSLPGACDLVYTMHRDVFRGKARMQLQVVRIDAVGQAVSLPYKTGGRFRIVDRRGEANRVAALRDILDQYGATQVQVWDESTLPLDGGALPGNLLNRLQLQAGPVLVIASVPPGPEELSDVLKRAGPQTVVLLTPAAMPDFDRPPVFMQQLTGMIKAAEHRGESVDDANVIARMAARIGQREVTVRAGIECYRQMASAGKGLGQCASFTRLDYFLGETRGYRLYFQQVRAEALLA